MRIGDWSSDVSSSDLRAGRSQGPDRRPPAGAAGGRPRSEGGLTMRFEVNGRTVFAATGGRPFDPALPALVFVHGAGMDHTVWTLQTRYFAYHGRSEEHTSELQSLMRISYAVFCLQKKHKNRPEQP